MTLRRIVVVGNGIAGLTACDSLRAAGFDGELTVVGAERHSPYSRPALSKALLHGSGGLAAHGLPEPTHGADELLGVSATGLDAGARVVTLDGGGSLPYDGLVIASGSRARRLGGGPQEEGNGHDSSRELTLRTLEDAVQLKELVAARPSVIVVGGGPLGMEVASGCLHNGCDVTLVTDGEPLVRQLGGYLSGIFASAARRQGLRIVNGPKARLCSGSTSGSTPGVALPDGTVLEADLVVSAIGDEPNTGWLEGSGLLTGGVLRVDSRGRVRPDIVAAGDVAFFPTQRGLTRVPLWTSAIDQAKAAAVGLLLGDIAPALELQPYFWTEAFGLSLKSVGYTPVEGAPGFREQGSDDDSALLRWEHADGSGTAAALNYRIPVPKLRRLANTGSKAVRPPQPVTA
ncbi:FAD-dependent pyridine nucleotide-disulphide oxidoreductase [Pseudarthrobacter chlorophenolicus A6]|uniref:FAD-dependent pyridine nucleotide-disulphide oxidoreductase n=1 Tax=Pseudarthrobacter chlorophenolicus (strain ATCC 700700 / DSM 12829 / CIP 107037 / JCM 12360 / KCTC 9906 / NCIMB 13794 / A6) TaxID=452863 RepID=B8HC50_PSECP|nr:FAD/NAD(P)-binding oxidoreductase [Pseudarthrobacter chlorophenolicus]ACL38760.1 FAD-dependent pyridine nucleotide-disulphide oxidoreductase [Pseudarthrobacter chlorophenolicus A6]SDR09114.1 NADPH-dependent 2,4-dienoyl-CoA reductase, sulfur reductase [Pseudarthrobacter chlorophenolicus]